MAYQPYWMGQQAEVGLKWVNGEEAAKAYPMPTGWPPNKPIALWDTNDTVIYLKSCNQMGMPNPLQKARYQLEEMVPKHRIEEEAKDLGWIEDELRKMREEIDAMKGEKK